MQSLFKPFVAVEAPIRYFVVLFIMFFGGLHIADDIGYIRSSNHSDLGHMLGLGVLFTALIFFSRYQAQRKAKREAFPNSVG